MTQIICSWLNDDLKVSQYIDEDNFSSAFCNGFLIGEILKKYDLMDNFDRLSKKNSSEAKLNNFILLEPTLKLLGLPFNNSIAKDIMDSKFSVLINVMYQLFIALENKKKSNTTALAMQTMQAPAITHIQEIESVLYQQRLKKITPRQADMDLKDLIKKYQDHQHHMQMKAERDRILSAEGHKEDTEKHRQNCLNRSKLLREEQDKKMKRIEAAIVKIPKPPPNKTIEAIQRNKILRNQKEAKIALKELDEFERRQRNIISQDKNDERLIFSREDSFSHSEDGVTEESSLRNGNLNEDFQIELDYIRPQNNKEYMNRIRARLESDKESRIAREKRRRKVLMNCLKSHHQQEENERENMIAMRLMRQSQMERRIAVQLLQSRHEKNIIKSNRLEREQQYQKRREIEFINAMDKEKELIEQMKLTNRDNLNAEQELYDLKKTQNKLLKYQKHFNMAENIVNNIIDISCKISEYKTLTEGNIPSKLIKEWKLAFINGVPIYDVVTKMEDTGDNIQNELDAVVIQDISVPLERQAISTDDMKRKLEIFDEEDLMEYSQLIGEWEINEEAMGPMDRKNNILDWIVDRLQRFSNPINENDNMPLLPNFPIKAAVVGKCFSGKTMLIKSLTKNNRCIAIVPQNVINEAVTAFKSKETVEMEVPIQMTFTNNLINENSKIDEDKTENQVLDINLNSSLNEPGMISEVNEVDVSVKVDENFKSVEIKNVPSPRAILGEKIHDELMNGRSVNDQLLVEAIIENIKRIPEGTGWIIDDFPATYQQAKLFEKATMGYEDSNSKSNQKKNQKPNVVNRQCGLDALILLSTSDRDCLARAMTCSESQLNNTSEASNITNDVIANLQTSLTNFAEHWPKLSKFYSRLNEKLIRIVNSDQNMTPVEVYLQVEIILDDIVKQKETPEPPIEIIEIPPVEIVTPVEIPVQDEVIDASKEIAPTKKSGLKSRSSSRASSAGSKSSGKKVASRKSRSKSKSGSANSKADKKASEKEVSKKKDNVAAKRKGSKGSKGSRDSKGSKSSSKGSRGGSGRRKKSKAQVVVDSDKQENIVPEVSEPQPGDNDWVYSEKPINQEMSSIFYSFWESLNNVYQENCKQAFRDVRHNRDEIIHYLHAIKVAFRLLLDRPDAKQEYLDQFQKDFNDIADEWREDEEVQQELHQRISELKDQLLEISQESQAEAEKEIESLKNNRWIEDQVGLVTNQYLNLMQSEFDRFQDVVRFLKDYYKFMISSQLDEFKPEFLRLPIIEIPTEKEETPDQIDSNVEINKQATVNTANANQANKKGAPKVVGKPQGNEVPGLDDVKELTEEEIEAMFKTKVPLIDYKTPGPQITSAILTSIPISGKQAKGDKAVAGGGISKMVAGMKSDKKSEKLYENIAPPNDLDEKLLYDTLIGCFTFANSLIEMEISLIGQKDEPDKAAANVGNDKAKTDKKGKGGKKSRTPTPKKGGKDKSATITSAKSRSRSGSAKKKDKGKDKNVPSKDIGDTQQKNAEETEEDRQNKLFVEKAKAEYIAALQKEAAILRTNVKVIMYKGGEILKQIKSKIESSFENFSNWIADKLLKEDIYIKKIENMYRYHVEDKKPVKEKVEIINHECFLISIEDLDKKPQLEIRPPPIDSLDENYFTVYQLQTFVHLFESITNAEDSSISLIDFVQFINESLMASDPKSLPVFINQTSHLESSIANIADTFSCDKEYVNWRLFLLACTEPWSWPTQTDLLDTLFKFKDLDQSSSGFITREQYDFVDLWFSIPSTPSTPADISIPKTINRKSEIKKLFFNIFKSGKFVSKSVDVDRVTEVEYMDYENMLLHFAVFCTNNFYSGIIRALSVSIGASLPHIPVVFKDIDLPLDENDEFIPDTNEDFLISVQDMYKVLSFGRRKTTTFDNGLANVDLEDIECERDTTLIKSLRNIYQSVQETEELTAKFSSLLRHEELLEWFTSCQWFKHVDIRSFFSDASETVRISTDA